MSRAEAEQLQLGPEALSLLYLPRVQAQHLWELQCLASESSLPSSASHQASVAPACAEEMGEQPPQLLVGALVLVHMQGSLKLRRVTQTTKAAAQTRQQQQQNQSPHCRLHLQGGQVVGLEELDPRTMEQLSDKEICRLLCEHAYWADAASEPPLRRQDVADTLHKLWHGLWSWRCFQGMQPEARTPASVARIQSQQLRRPIPPPLLERIRLLPHHHLLPTRSIAISHLRRVASKLEATSAGLGSYRSPPSPLPLRPMQAQPQAKGLPEQAKGLPEQGKQPATPNSMKPDTEIKQQQQQEPENVAPYASQTPSISADTSHPSKPPKEHVSCKPSETTGRTQRPVLHDLGGAFPASQSHEVHASDGGPQQDAGEAAQHMEAVPEEELPGALGAATPALQEMLRVRDRVLCPPAEQEQAGMPLAHSQQPRFNALTEGLGQELQEQQLKELQSEMAGLEQEEKGEEQKEMDGEIKQHERQGGMERKEKEEGLRSDGAQQRDWLEDERKQRKAMKHQAVTAHMGSFNFQAMSELPEPARSKAAPPRPSPPFKVCYFFNTPAGCYKGGKCPFVHIKNLPGPPPHSKQEKVKAKAEKKLLKNQEAVAVAQAALRQYQAAEEQEAQGRWSGDGFDLDEGTPGAVAEEKQAAAVEGKEAEEKEKKLKEGKKHRKSGEREHTKKRDRKDRSRSGSAERGPKKDKKKKARKHSRSEERGQEKGEGREARRRSKSVERDQEDKKHKKSRKHSTSKERGQEKQKGREGRKRSRSVDTEQEEDRGRDARQRSRSTERDKKRHEERRRRSRSVERERERQASRERCRELNYSAKKQRHAALPLLLPAAAPNLHMLSKKDRYFKTIMCRSFLHGSCAMGNNCGYAHSTSELRTQHQNIEKMSAKYPSVALKSHPIPKKLSLSPVTVDFATHLYHLGHVIFGGRDCLSVLRRACVEFLVDAVTGTQQMQAAMLGNCCVEFCPEEVAETKTLPGKGKFLVKVLSDLPCFLRFHRDGIHMVRLDGRALHDMSKVVSIQRAWGGGRQGRDEIPGAQGDTAAATAAAAAAAGPALENRTKTYKEEIFSERGGGSSNARPDAEFGQAAHMHTQAAERGYPPGWQGQGWGQQQAAQHGRFEGREVAVQQDAQEEGWMEREYARGAWEGVALLQQGYAQGDGLGGGDWYRQESGHGGASLGGHAAEEAPAPGAFKEIHEEQHVHAPDAGDVGKCYGEQIYEPEAQQGYEPEVWERDPEAWQQEGGEDVELACEQGNVPKGDLCTGWEGGAEEAVEGPQAMEMEGGEQDVWLSLANMHRPAPAPGQSSHQQDASQPQSAARFHAPATAPATAAATGPASSMQPAVPCPAVPSPVVPSPAVPSAVSSQAQPAVLAFARTAPLIEGSSIQRLQIGMQASAREGGPMMSERGPGRREWVDGSRGHGTSEDRQKRQEVRGLRRRTPERGQSPSLERCLRRHTPERGQSPSLERRLRRHTPERGRSPSLERRPYTLPSRRSPSPPKPHAYSRASSRSLSPPPRACSPPPRAYSPPPRAYIPPPRAYSRARPPSLSPPPYYLYPRFSPSPIPPFFHHRYRSLPPRFCLPFGRSLSPPPNLQLPLIDRRQ